MYRIAVCEDEPIFLKYISEMTVDILSSIGESCEIWKYTSALGLESALQEDSGAYDILILDIMLGEINGVSFMEYLRDHGNCVPVIFISSSEKFVFDAYSAEPVGYILKPVSRQKLAEALNRAIEVINKELLIHLQDGTVTRIYKTLSSMKEILPKDIFVQCHRCYIVSLYAVRSIKRFEITLKNHETIPVSKYSYKEVQEQLQQYAAKWF